MASKLPFMPFFGRDFYDDDRVARMNFAEHGMYLRLLWHQWVNDSLPGDSTDLARMLGVSEIAPVLLECFPITASGRRINPRLRAERRRIEVEREAKIQGGKRGRRKQLQTQPRLSPDSVQAELGQPEPEPEKEPVETPFVVREDLAGKENSEVTEGSTAAPDGAEIHQGREWARPYYETWVRRFGGKPDVGWLRLKVEPLEKADGRERTVTRWDHFIGGLDARFFRSDKDPFRGAVLRFAGAPAAYDDAQWHLSDRDKAEIMRLTEGL